MVLPCAQQEGRTGMFVTSPNNYHSGGARTRVLAAGQPRLCHDHSTVTMTVGTYMAVSRGICCPEQFCHLGWGERVIETHEVKFSDYMLITI